MSNFEGWLDEDEVDGVALAGPGDGIRHDTPATACIGCPGLRSGNCCKASSTDDPVVLAHRRLIAGGSFIKRLTRRSTR